MYSVEMPKLIEKPGRTGVLRKKRRDWVTIGTMSWLDKAAQGCGRKANDHHEDGRLKEWHCKPRLCTCQSRSHAVPPAARISGAARVAGPARRHCRNVFPGCCPRCRARRSG